MVCAHTYCDKRITVLPFSLKQKQKQEQKKIQITSENTSKPLLTAFSLQHILETICLKMCVECEVFIISSKCWAVQKSNETTESSLWSIVNKRSYLIETLKFVDTIVVFFLCLEAQSDF